MRRIPKKLHFVWIGNEARRPNRCIESWKRLNPDYEVTVWGNELFEKTEWINIFHIFEMMKKELNGVADMMRYEILYNHGGIALDADSFCVRKLEDWLLEPTEFGCWENELNRPGLIGCNAIGAIPDSPFIGQIIKEINEEKSVVDDMAWKTVGPLRVTNTWKNHAFPLTIYPSHYFAPNHFSAPEYAGQGPVFATQLWASTHNTYDKI